MKTTNPWFEISRLLAVLGVGMVAACLTAGFMLHYYGPTGRYDLENVLLSPSTLEVLSKKGNPVEGKRMRNPASQIAFDTIKYSFFNPETKQWQQEAPSLSSYKQFYQEIKDDTSVQEVNANIINLFASGLEGRLEIVGTSSENNTSKPLQILEIARGGDVYRVDLRNEGNKDNFVYFQHSGIGNVARQKLRNEM